MSIKKKRKLIKITNRASNIALFFVGIARHVYEISSMIKKAGNQIVSKGRNL